MVFSGHGWLKKSPRGCEKRVVSESDWTSKIVWSGMSEFVIQLLSS